MSTGRLVLDREPLDDIVRAFVAERPCPRLAWGVTTGDVVVVGGLGDATEHTVFRIASMTKSFSAAATLLLRDEGTLRLDEPIATYAPELADVCRSDDAPPVTVRDLLAMTSGLPTDDPWADRHLDLTDDALDRIVAAGPLVAAPTGTRYEYSNFGYALLGRVVWRACGQRLQDVVSSRLLEPLGLGSTTWTRPPHDDWARPTRRTGTADVQEHEPLGDGTIAPMGGLWTTVADLRRWVAWLDDAFPARDAADDGPLRRSSRREMQQPMRYARTLTVRGVRAPASYGYGLMVFDEPELGTVVTHSGGLPGYGSNMRWLPGRGASAIALANTTYAPMSELAAKLLDEVAAQVEPFDRARPDARYVEAAGHDLVALLNDWSDVAARRLVTNSLVLDDGLDTRAAAARELVDQIGQLSVERIEAVTALRGSLVAAGADGARVEISFSLAPRRPPQLQAYEIKRLPSD